MTRLAGSGGRGSWGKVGRTEELRRTRRGGANKKSWFTGTNTIWQETANFVSPTRSLSSVGMQLVASCPGVELVVSLEVGSWQSASGTEAGGLQKMRDESLAW